MESPHESTCDFHIWACSRFASWVLEGVGFVGGGRAGDYLGHGVG